MDDSRFLNSRKKVICFGEGQWASIAHYYFEHDTPHNIVASCVDAAYRKSSDFLGKPLVDFETVSVDYPPDEHVMFLPISFKRMSHFRRERFEQAKAMGYTCISYVSSKTSCWPDLSIGENCFITENNVIQPYVKIGDNCVIWSGNFLGHHTVIEDHVHMTCGIVVNGECTIKSHSFLGASATIRDETIVEKETLVAMGTVVTKDTHPYSVWFGAKPRILDKKSSDYTSLSHKAAG